MQFRSHFKIPAPQTELENCVAHNGSLVPVPGRDIFVQAWYQGGISVIDFTDSSNPVEIAFFDRGPVDAQDLVMGGYWSAYWYRGFIYGTEIARGLDVFTLTPSEYLSVNEIAAASLGGSEIVNPQQQRRHVWPAEPVVAKAYLDQLLRDDAIEAGQASALAVALDDAAAALDGEQRENTTVASELDRVGDSLTLRLSDPSQRTRERLIALTDTLAALIERLRGRG